jgi:hypothetical protein
MEAGFGKMGSGIRIVVLQGKMGGAVERVLWSQQRKVGYFVSCQIFLFEFKTCTLYRMIGEPVKVSGFFPIIKRLILAYPVCLNSLNSF